MRETTSSCGRLGEDVKAICGNCALPGNVDADLNIVDIAGRFDDRCADWAVAGRRRRCGPAATRKRRPATLRSPRMRSSSPTIAGVAVVPCTRRSADHSDSSPMPPTKTRLPALQPKVQRPGARHALLHHQLVGGADRLAPATDAGELAHLGRCLADELVAHFAQRQLARDARTLGVVGDRSACRSRSRRDRRSGRAGRSRSAGEGRSGSGCEAASPIVPSAGDRAPTGADH